MITDIEDCYMVEVHTQIDLCSYLVWFAFVKPSIMSNTVEIIIIYSCINQLFDMRHARRSSSVGDCIYIVLINNEM